jgi:serine/threonine protein kinase
MDQTIGLGATTGGTQPYMPPEMFSNKQRGLQSDIWSAGIIVYYLATGKLPFDPSNLETLKQQILNLEPPVLPQNYTNEFKSIVMVMLNKNSSFRQTAETLFHGILQDFPQYSTSSSQHCLRTQQQTEKWYFELLFFTLVSRFYQTLPIRD